MSNCVICKKSKGKFLYGCLCKDATVHRQCFLCLASKLYANKTDRCNICNTKISCLKKHHFTQVARYKLKKRLEFTGITFGKTGMVPTCYKGMESQKDDLQIVWEKVIDEELEDCPDFVKKTLKTTKKRKFEFVYRAPGTKWD